MKILRRTALWLLAGLCALTAVASLSWPLGYDHGCFAWIGSVVLGGGVPYRDAWDPKGPMVFFSHAAIQWLLGHNTWGLRLADLLLIAATTMVLSRHLRRWTSPRLALWFAVLFPLAYADGTFYATAQPDGWATMVLVLALVPAWSSRAGRATIVACVIAGMAVAMATMVKPFYAAFLPLALIRTSEATREAPRLAARTAAILAGFAVPIALVLVWFARQGALGDLVDTYVLYTLKVHSGIQESSLGSRVAGVIEYLRDTPALAAEIPVGVVGILHAWRRNRPLAIAWTAWAVLAVATVFLQNKFFTYHWLPLLPPLAGFFALGAHAVLEVLAPRDPPAPAAAGSNGPVRTLLVATVAAIALYVAIHPAFEVARFIGYATGRVDADAYAMGFTTPGPDRRAARYIREHSSPDDTVVIWG